MGLLQYGKGIGEHTPRPVQNGHAGEARRVAQVNFQADMRVNRWDETYPSGFEQLPEAELRFVRKSLDMEIYEAICQVLAHQFGSPDFDKATRARRFRSLIYPLLRLGDLLPGTVRRDRRRRSGILLGCPCCTDPGWPLALEEVAGSQRKYLDAEAGLALG